MTPRAFKLALLCPLLTATGSMAADVIDLAATPFEPRAAVAPLLVLAIDSRSSAALQSSWPAPYQSGQDYEGYFHHGLCYKSGKDVFQVSAMADGEHYCADQNWSGNFLNWASMSRLDTLRYGLMGGLRSTDQARLTVLERADLGAGFTQTLATGSDNAQLDISRLTPFKLPQLVLRSCGQRVQVWNTAPDTACGGSASTGLLADLPLRVEVCKGEDQRAALCRAYGRNAKPEGLLQAASPWLRIALLQGDAGFVGGELIGAQALASDWTRQDNAQPEWNLKNGVLANGKTVLRELSRGSASVVPDSDVALLQSAQSSQSGLLRATCQKTHVLRWPAAADAGMDGQQQLTSLRRRFARLLLDTQLESLPPRVTLALARERTLFVAESERGDLSSRLSRNELLKGEDGKLLMPTEAQWQASVPAPDQRRVFITGSQGKLIPLAISGLSAPQLDGLRHSPYGIGSDGLLLPRLSWLAGDGSTQERNGGALASRSRDFGSQLAGNLAYLETGRPDMPGLILMSTGEGLLHTIDAASGREVFAWMPQSLLSHLAQVAAPDYPALSLLDGGLGLSLRARQGKSLSLVSLAGGHSLRAVFALEFADATDPEAKQWRAWEFTSADDARLGNVLHAPQLVRIASRQGNAMVQRPFLLFSAGVNVAAGLFLLALDQPAHAIWEEGSNFFYLPATAVGADPSRHLTAPALVLGEDQRLLHAWAGDGQGRMWRFSFEDSAKAAAGFKVTTTMLFSAAENGKAQFISAAPRIAYAPDKAYLVLFGTGRWLEFGDAAPGVARQESFYGVLDRLSGASLKRADLAPRLVQAVQGGFQVKSAQSDATANGWLVDFPELGERVTESALLEGGRVLINTHIAPADPCLPGRQRAWEFDVLQGSNELLAGRDMASTLQAPLLLRMASTAAPDALGRRAPGSTMVIADLPQAGEALPAQSLQDPQHSGRLAWREITNWSRLHEAQTRP